MGQATRPLRRAILTCLVVSGGLSMAACEDESSAAAGPVNIESHLYGPGARLGNGVTVPEGAARVGPTVRIEGDPGGLDSQISLLQIDGDPDDVMRELLTQLDERIPDADVRPERSRRRCWLDATDQWIRQCRLLVAGHTPRGEPIQVDVTVTPTADVDGRPLPGANGLPQARVLVRTGVIREVGTNLFRPPGYAYSIRDQEAAQWPIAPDADGSVVTPTDSVPGAEDWPIQPGGVPIGVVYSNPRYVVVAVDEGADVHEVAMSYISAVPNVRLTSRRIATVGDRVTTSYEIDEVDDGPSANVWAIDRPGTDYLFLRYWPTGI
jgi:hypothetical protein